jgi:pimeloyl-ACP methyl ester carboxylesterase
MGRKIPHALARDSYRYDQYFLEREGNKEIQLDLLYNYQDNIMLYSKWQKYLRTNRPPALITWGKNDAMFTAAGAIAYKKDLPDAELHLLNTGHFALEEFHLEISKMIKPFLNKINLCK